MLRRTLLLLGLSLLLAGSNAVVRAEDRALLVAIGDYPIAEARLPAVGKDVARIRDAVRTLGYGDRQVRLLVDEAATLVAITGAIRDWLIAGAGGSDRVLIYLNGHGSQIHDDDGDEEDGVDEVFLPYDFKPAAGTLVNVLIDDELGRLLAQIPAREVVVLLDTCHSGSLATRSPAGFVARFYRYPGMPAGRTRGFLLEGSRSEPANVIAVSAAGEDEKSQASERTGGLFTRAVAEAVAAASSHGYLSPEGLRSQAARSIAKALAAEPERLHRPRLYGNPKLQGINLFLPAPPRPPLWAELERLVDAAAGSLEVTAGQSVYSLESSLAISLRVPRDGHLNVVNLGAGESEIVLLFPNRYHPDNRVTAGELIRIPPPGSLRLPARLPAGIDEQDNLIVVFHTVEPLNLYERGRSMGEAFRIFREQELTAAVRGSHLSGYFAGFVVVTIRR